MLEVMGTQVEVEVESTVLVMEALMGGMEGMDPLAVEERVLVKISPCTPSPPGAWARGLGDNIIFLLLATSPTTMEEEEAG